MDTSTHYIGGNSSFDQDMSFYENVVNYHVRRDKIDVDTLYHYYISQLLSYWNKIIDLYSFDNEADARRVLKIHPSTSGYSNKFVEIKQNFSLYETFFHEILTRIKKEYDSRGILDNDLIIGLFNYISIMACFEVPEKFDTINSPAYDNDNEEYSHWTMGLKGDYITGIYLEDYMDRVYVLVNDSGEFSINGFMYSYINGIILLGIPSSFSTYDDNIGCPKRFLIHDYDHVSEMMTPRHIITPVINLYDLDVINNIKPLYYSILNSDLDKNHKEYLIFVLWAAIHEVNDLNLLRVSDDIMPSPFSYQNVMKKLSFFELKEEDYDGMVNVNFVGKNEISEPYWGRIAMIHYYNDYIRDNFPDLFKKLGIHRIKWKKKRR